MRKTIEVIIQDDNRDKGKRFKITEMSAHGAEEWAIRAIFAMMNAGIDIPDDAESSGFAGIASMGLQALGKVPFEQAKPLLDSMMECVQIMPNPNDSTIIRNLIDDDIEEISTRIRLRKAIWDLHTDFFIDKGK